MTALMRQLLALGALLLLGGGYVGSQVAAMNGRHAEFAYQMDQFPIRVLAAVLLVGALVLALVPDDLEDRNGGER